MAKVCGKDILPEVRLPKPRKPYQPRPNARHKHNMEERIIEKAVISYLRGRGFKCGKITPETGAWNAGIADVLCFTPSGQWWIEIKTHKGKQQENQIEFQQMLEGIGAKYIVARSVDDVRHIQ